MLHYLAQSFIIPHVRADIEMSFTAEEEAKFAKRFENGYDLVHDTRYNHWLSVRHADSEYAPGMRDIQTTG